MAANTHVVALLSRHDLYLAVQLDQLQPSEQISPRYLSSSVHDFDTGDAYGG